MACKIGGMNMDESQAVANARHWVCELESGRIARSEFDQIVVEHAEMGDSYRIEFDSELTRRGYGPMK